jgi:hypothetical protein
MAVSTTAMPTFGAFAAAARPPPGPVLTSEAVDVRRFGAVGDGKTLCTAALQSAIDTCAHGGGGVVLLPAGQFLSGALSLRSNIELHLSAGATLLGSPSFDHYPPIPGRADGIERTVYSSLLTGQDLENVAITGQGVIDGQGPPWWQAHTTTRDTRLARGLPREADNPPDVPLRWPLPRLINLLRCQRVTISGLAIRHAPSYNIHLVYCQDVTIEQVGMAGLEAQHCDGIIVDSCKQVRIAGCCIGSGGESIALKSGYNEDGRRVAVPCEDIVVTNCNLFYSPGAAIAIGSETAAGIKNVTIANCAISNCKHGVHIRSPRGRGGVVQGIRASNLVLDHIGESALFMTHFFDSVRMDNLFGEGPSPKGNPELDRSIKPRPDEGTPTFQNISLSGLTLGDVPRIATIEGLPERFITGVTITDVSAPRARAGISLQRVSRVRISGLDLGRTEGPAVAARDVERLEIHRLTAEPAARSPVIELQNVDGAFIHGCDVAQRGPDARFVQLHGQRNRGIRLSGNNEP